MVHREAAAVVLAALVAVHVATSCNAMVHIDEYRNDLELEKREFLKGIWDSVGRMRMNMDKDKKKEMTSVDQSVILTGQQLATADIALFTRFIFLSFTQTEYTDQERKDFCRYKRAGEARADPPDTSNTRVERLFQGQFQTERDAYQRNNA